VLYDGCFETTEGGSVTGVGTRIDTSEGPATVTAIDIEMPRDIVPKGVRVSAILVDCGRGTS
jgi:hypothetical protein